MRFARSFSIAVALFAGSGLYAGTVTQIVGVSGTTMPWLWTSGGLNTSFQYGFQDGTAPVFVCSTDGFSFTEGATLDITFLGGSTRNDVNNPAVVPAGVDGYDPGHNVVLATNSIVGQRSGMHYATNYISGDPVYLNSLLGVFADSNGTLVGTGFAIGNSLSVVVPVGATRLQFGIDDDIFFDNDGLLTVLVQQDTQPIPEPGTLHLMALAFVATGIVAYRRKQLVH